MLVCVRLLSSKNHKYGMRFKDFLLESIVPSLPGSTPIPPGCVRLYHYVDLRDGSTEEQTVKDIKQNGIDIKRAKGSSYGEPNVVWASTQIPGRNKIFVEFNIPWNDPRWLIGKPNSPADVDRLNKSSGDVIFKDSIRPEEIAAIHLPWHHIYNYLVNSNKIQDVLDGKFDHLLKKPDSNEAKAIKYIKSS